ncbi:MAG TPA: hypothetical protein VE011_01110 [Candidatus Dormibacteraeota bacterium]|nr:hypothetical protein [Candidatus Dormibacteraeota bacterium]
MTAATSGGPVADARLDDLRIARVHLRLGQLTLARAELEDLFRRDALDTGGLAVLAEARWRTGDADAAAQAAVAHLGGGGSDDVALCIAAEAAALDGRASEARDLMDRLPHADAVTLDAIFAGLPRRAPWPMAPVERTDPSELRREAAGRPDAGRAMPPRVGSEPGGQPAPTAATAPDRPAVSTGRRVRAQLDPLAELTHAREELETRPDRAFLRLAIVLRHDPTLAPAVLDALHLRREPGAALLRGDAQRLLGRHLEAEAAYDAAAESLEVS